MGKIIIKASIILLLVLLPAIAMNWATSLIKNKIGYQYAYTEKLEALQNISSKKLVLVGGSSLAFGIDSKMLQDSLGIPVFNLGFHAGLGLRFPLETVKPYLKSGDIVLVMPEYEIYQNGLWLGEAYLANVVLTDIGRYWPLLNTAQRYIVVKNYFRASFTNLAFEFTGKHDPNSYKRNEFNSQGDYIGHHNKTSDKGIAPRMIRVESFNPAAIDYLAENKAYFTAKGVTMLVGYPGILKEGIVPKEQFAATVEKNLEAHELDLVGHPDDYLIDRQDVYDTEYHLTMEGKAKRAQKLLENLRGKM